MMKEISSRPVEILLVEDNPGDVRLTVEALKEGKRSWPYPLGIGLVLFLGLEFGTGLHYLHYNYLVYSQTGFLT